MPSRAESRAVAERLLRAVVIGALGVLLWQSLRSRPTTKSDVVQARTLTGELPAWSAAAVAPPRIQVQLDSAPTTTERAWLRALTASGSRITWSGDIPAVMIAAHPVAAPGGGMRIRAASPSGSLVELRDEVGVLDTLRARNAGASLVVPSSDPGVLTARVAHARATTSLRDSVNLHRVLVIGSAGWESKFVIAALEENGWKVDAFVPVAPGIDVTQGSTAVIDTAKYSAVIALDRAAAPYAGRIAAFVRSGGGVVLAPQAAGNDAMSALRAADLGRSIPAATTIERASSVSLATLAFDPLVGLRNDAVPLDRRTNSVSVAARRIGAGRTLQIGYEDTWRWRMNGSENSVRDHRTWWTGLVSSVAYAPRAPIAKPIPLSDDAPLAGLVEALGPKTEANVANGAANPSHWMAWLFAIMALALIAETASRRLRGAR